MNGFRDNCCAFAQDDFPLFEGHAGPWTDPAPFGAALFELSPLAQLSRRVMVIVKRSTPVLLVAPRERRSAISFGTVIIYKPHFGNLLIIRRQLC